VSLVTYNQFNGFLLNRSNHFFT